jgi:ribosomal RNA-processing protein 9
MPDAFFANSKKRKRDPSGINSKPYKPLKKPKFSQPSTSKQKKRKDEELSSGESSLASDDDNRRDGQGDANLSGEEDARETAAEKRLRLARVYLESVKNELGTSYRLYL